MIYQPEAPLPLRYDAPVPPEGYVLCDSAEATKNWRRAIKYAQPNGRDSFYPTGVWVSFTHRHRNDGTDYLYALPSTPCTPSSTAGPAST
jgi:hypothetical protein